MIIYISVIDKGNVRIKEEKMNGILEKLRKIAWDEFGRSPLNSVIIYLFGLSALKGGVLVFKVFRIVCLLSVLYK